jgi:hypothetical protein
MKSNRKKIKKNTAKCTRRSRITLERVVRQLPHFVIGTIDTYGHIEHRETWHTETHTKDERVRGHCWRWNCCRNEFNNVLGSEALYPGEGEEIRNYLITNGYAYYGKTPDDWDEHFVRQSA